MTFAHGSLVFPIGDSGVVLLPGDSVELRLAADIESDVPYRNFRLLLTDAQELTIVDDIDTVHSPSLSSGWQCTAALPFETRLTRVYLPAGEPELQQLTDGVRIVSAGQESAPVGGLRISYAGGEPRGDIELSSMQCAVFRRDRDREQRIDPADVMSRVQLVCDQATLAVDSILGTDRVDLVADTPLSIHHQQTPEFSLLADLRANIAPGVYCVRLMDSSALGLSDVNLSTVVIGDLPWSDYPATIGTFSVAAAGLSASFSNYPNPFVPSEAPTTIAYILDEDAHVDIELFTITGEPVAQVSANEYRTAGAHQDQTWDGLNDVGRMVVPGTYFCRITARYVSGRTETVRRKVAVLR